MARGGKAYGLLPSQSRGAPACAQTVEVMSASGASCGTATFKIAAPSCTTQSIDVGYDGTVLQQLPTEMEAQSSAGPVSCTLRWWPGFLR